MCLRRLPHVSFSPRVGGRVAAGRMRPAACSSAGQAPHPGLSEGRGEGGLARRHFARRPITAASDPRSLRPRLRSLRPWHGAPACGGRPGRCRRSRLRAPRCEAPGCAWRLTASSSLGALRPLRLAWRSLPLRPRRGRLLDAGRPLAALAATRGRRPRPRRTRLLGRTGLRPRGAFGTCFGLWLAWLGAPFRAAGLPLWERLSRCSPSRRPLRPRRRLPPSAKSPSAGGSPSHCGPSPAIFSMSFRILRSSGVTSEAANPRARRAPCARCGARSRPIATAGRS